MFALSLSACFWGRRCGRNCPSMVGWAKETANPFWGLLEEFLSQKRAETWIKFDLQLDWAGPPDQI